MLSEPLWSTKLSVINLFCLSFLKISTNQETPGRLHKIVDACTPALPLHTGNQAARWLLFQGMVVVDNYGFTMSKPCSHVIAQAICPLNPEWQCAVVV